MSKISISRDGVWAGNGRINDDGQIEDCAAILGVDQDTSNETYEAIEDAIAGGYEAEDTSITRPDGVYTWTVSD